MRNRIADSADSVDSKMAVRKISGELVLILTRLLDTCLPLFFLQMFRDQSMLIQLLFGAAPNRMIKKIEIETVAWYVCYISIQISVTLALTCG
jgi:hypothetical protein